MVNNCVPSTSTFKITIHKTPHAWMTVRLSEGIYTFYYIIKKQFLHGKWFVNPKIKWANLETGFQILSGADKGSRLLQNEWALVLVLANVWLAAWSSNTKSAHNSLRHLPDRSVDRTFRYPHLRRSQIRIYEF